MTTLDWCYYPGCKDHPSPTGPPKHPNPTYNDLIQWHDKTAKWEATHKPATDPTTKDHILGFIETAATAEDILASMRIAELAGLCWYSIEQKDWQWQD